MSGIRDGMDESDDRSDVDRSRIHETILGYGHSVDAGRFDELESHFTEDAEIRALGNRIVGRAAIRDWMEQVQPPQARGRHVTSNTAIEFVDDRRARAVSDFVFLARDGDGWVPRREGRYLDELERVGDRWCFTRRSIELHPVPSNPDANVIVD